MFVLFVMTSWITWKGEKRDRSDKKKKVKEYENGIGIAGARNLSSEAGEGGRVSKQTGKILDLKVLAKQSATGAGQTLHGNPNPHFSRPVRYVDEVFTPRRNRGRRSRK